MTVNLNKITLASIFETLEIDKALIGGTATGTFTASQALSKIPMLATDNLHVDNIAYNYCTIGNADVSASWNNERQAFSWTPTSPIRRDSIPASGATSCRLAKASTSISTPSTSR